MSHRRKNWTVIYFRMRSGKVSLHSVWKAFDEAEFGTKNILNLRESLPTAADARYRAEAWLRERQISGTSEVLLITGRGNQSPGGVSAVRAAIVALLPALRRRGVVSEWREHTPGSFVVMLGSISSLLDVPRRKRDRALVATPPDPKSLAELEASTLSLLRQLAVRSLESLGVRHPEKFVEAEMLSKFNSLAGAIAPGVEGEARLRAAMSAALDQLDD
jgi:hypothetical protein